MSDAGFRAGGDVRGETAHPGGLTTGEQPTLSSGAAVSARPDETPSLDEDDEWPVRGPARGIRLAAPTAGLVAVLLVGAGFWGGAALQKNHGSSASPASGAAALLARFRAGTSGASGPTGAAGAFGFGGGLGAGGSAVTAGTVSVVAGDTLYVLTSDGSLVEVKLGSSTAITRNAKTQPVELRPGDTVVVQGAAGKSGAVNATSVAATAPGVTASTGGFGRFRAGANGTTAGAAGG